MRRHLSLAAMAIGCLFATIQRPAFGYLPIECVTDSYKDDFQESPLVVIGRVTGIERYRSTRDKEGVARESYFYVATVEIGRTLKGDAKPNDEILFFMGDSCAGEHGNLRSGILTVANSHGGWDLDVDNVYLLCLRPMTFDSDEQVDKEEKTHIEVRRDGKWQNAGLDKREVWKPRSCHNSIHRIIGGGTNSSPQRASLCLQHKKERPEEKYEPLDEFIDDLIKGRPAYDAREKAQAKEAGKKE